MTVHERYYAPHKYRGTPPAAKTIRRLQLQAINDIPVTSKLAYAHGHLLHPTKGVRNASH